MTPARSTSSSAQAAPGTVGRGDLQVLFLPAPTEDDDDSLFFWSLPEIDRSAVVARLAALGAAVDDNALRVESVELELPGASGAVVRPVSGHCMALDDGIAALVRVSSAEGITHAEPSDSLTAWSLAAKLTLELVARERLVPVLRGEPDTRQAAARWSVSIARAADRARFEVLAGAMPAAAFALASRPRPQDLLRTALDAFADTLVRRAFVRPTPIENGGERPAAGSRRPAPWEERFVAALTVGPDLFIPYGLGESRLVEELGRWARPALGAGVTEFSAAFTLEPPPPPEGAIEGPWHLHYALELAADPSVRLEAETIWAAAEDELHIDGHVVQLPHELLLRDLAEAARVFPPIADSLDEAHPTHVELSSREAWIFLSEAVLVLEDAGLGVHIPPALASRGGRRLRARLRIEETEVPAADGDAEDRPGVAGSSPADVAEPRPAAAPGSSSPDAPELRSVDAAGMRSDLPPPGLLGAGALAQFSWEAAIGDKALSPAEFKKLAALKQPLVRWHGEWLVVEPGVASELEKLLQKKSAATMSGTDALRALLTGTATTARGEEVEVVASERLVASVQNLRQHGFPDVDPPDDFHGTLRPYQERGLRWLVGMSYLGLGSCLADDMGLGKTIQLIAQLLHHLHAQPDDPRPALVICPTSVLGNWQREIERFGPALPVLRHHGADRARSVTALTHDLVPHTVILTTYALARRDRAVLSKVDWSHAVLDEAQYVKNPASQQAKAVRDLHASHRIALTGTPIENRLSELWSILEFLNPGLLGPLDRFRREVAIPVERYRDRGAEERLRRLVGPFLLRRLKTDPDVIRDLPEKLEMTVHCSLTREQGALYQAALDQLLDRIEGSQGMSRRGLILKLITSLKQICNHPAHFQREAGPLSARSGKLERLLDMVEEACAEGDRTLIYSQYREMGKLLVAAFGERLGVQVPFLHGGVSLAGRDELVRRFQEDSTSPPVFVLSLKAGGTGLNLTAANHVFHFDRWWNPAVEDQATDRAFRIGQTRNVQVHKLVTIGTLEERIDRMLNEKRDLAERIVGTGEAWLTEMSDGELRELFALSGDAVLEGAN